MRKQQYESVDDYLAQVQPEIARETLTRLREVIRDEVPEAVEGISYGMPVYNLHGALVYFGAFKKHLSFFPGRTLEDFKAELDGYVLGKGTIQFPFDNMIEADIVRRILRIRVAENLAKHVARSRTSTS